MLGRSHARGRAHPDDPDAIADDSAIKPLAAVGWVIPPRRNADFAAGMERVLD